MLTLYITRHGKNVRRSHTMGVIEAVHGVALLEKQKGCIN
jgi:hypothetical protein